MNPFRWCRHTIRFSLNIAVKEKNISDLFLFKVVSPKKLIFTLAVMILYLQLTVPPMTNTTKGLGKYASFKIVLIYAAVSAVYIYTSDYFLETFVSDIPLLTKLQTVKGLFFILITATLLYILVKRDSNKIAAYYRQIIAVKQLSDDQLLQSKEEYMSLFNHSPIPMWLFDIETYQFLQVNEAASSIYGYTQEEFLGMTLKDIRTQEDIPIMEEKLANSFENNFHAKPSIVRHKKKNGEIMQVKVKTSFVTFEGRKVRLASSMDVTAEMEIQAQLMDTNSKLQLASEIAGLGYWTNDLLTSQIQWSDEIYKIFEVDPHSFELTLDNIKDRFHPEDQNYFDIDVYDLLEDKTIRESEHRIYTKTGDIKWILERIHLLKNKDDKPIMLEGIVLDITKRKLHEQEIWESNERFTILARATVEAIIDWDIKNDTVMWGEGFQTMLGYDLSNSDKYLWSNNIHPEDREKVLEELHRTLEDPAKQYFNAEFRFLKANGDVAFVQNKGIFIRDVNGKATRALGAMIDLTETLERMRKIELQNKALKDISWTQSHVVRAPLANLLGFISLLKDNSATGERDDKLLDYVSDSAEKLDTIIRDIVKKTKEINDM